MIKHITKCAGLSWLVAFTLGMAGELLMTWMMGEPARQTFQIIFLAKIAAITAVPICILFAPLTAWALKNSKANKWFFLLWIILAFYIFISIPFNPFLSFLGSILLGIVGLILIGLFISKSKS